MLLTHWKRQAHQWMQRAAQLCCCLGGLIGAQEVQLLHCQRLLQTLAAAEQQAVHLLCVQLKPLSGAQWAYTQYS